MKPNVVVSPILDTILKQCCMCVSSAILLDQSYIFVTFAIYFMSDVI
jgi:hypothetical protein